MTTRTVRADVDALAVSVYAGRLHPDLFLPVASADVVWAGGCVRLQLLQSGHRVEAAVRGGRRAEALSEVLNASLDGQLPQGGRLVHRRLGQAANVSAACPGLRYSSSTVVDRLDAEVFERIDREVCRDAGDATLAARLPGAGRLAPGPASLLTAVPVDGGVNVIAVHTFPAEETVVRTQSLFELASTCKAA